MTFPPEVSVVIPTRNRWRRLQLALKGALVQRNVSVEVIIVDDGSTDGTAQRVAGLGDPRVRVFRHEVTQGVATARNRGIDEAHGRWVAFLDDDDLWAPAKLRVQLDAASRQDAAWVYSGGVLLDDRRRVLVNLRLPDTTDLARQLLVTNVIPAGASNVMVTADVLRSHGGFDQNLLQLADWDLWIRLAQNRKAAASGEVHVGYVGHGDNMLLEGSQRDVLREFEYLVVKHRTASAAYGVDFDRAMFYRFIAFGHRRGGHRARAAKTLLRSAVAYRNFENAILALGTLLGESTVRRGRQLARFSTLREPTWLRTYG